MSLKAQIMYSLALSALSAATSPAFAQDQSGGTAVSPAEPASASTDTLTDIVVTARRQSESILKVPVAASALNSAELARAGTSDILNLSGQIPGLKLDDTGGGGGSFSIRGIGSAVNDAGAEQSVVTVIDGVQTTRGVFINLGLLDLAQIEVLKGPQVLFFGKNSPAGVISLNSQRPTDKFEAYIKAGYEFGANEKKVEGAISGPLTETIRARLAGSFSEYDGWNRNVAGATANPFGALPGYSPTIPGASYNLNNRSSLIGRATIEYTPTPDLTATLRTTGARVRDRGPLATSETLCPGAHPDLFGIPDPYGDCIQNNRVASGAVPQQILSSHPLYKSKPYTHFDAFLDSLTLDYGSGPVRLTSVTGYLKYRLAQFQAANTTYGYPFFATDVKFHQLSQEFRVVTNYDAPINFTGGVYYESSKISTLAVDANLPNLADPATGNFQDSNFNAISNAKSYSAFGQVRWSLARQLELDAGVRYSHDERSNRLFNSFIDSNSTLAAVFAPVGVIQSGTVSFNNYSPEITLSWKPVRDTLVYSSYRTGYKAGGATATGLLSQSFNPATDLFTKPEKINGFELGGKTLLAGGRLRLTASAYKYKYKDLQIANFDASIFSVQPLAGDLKVKGFEADAAYRATHELTFSAGIAYSHSRYTDFGGVACYLGQTAAQGCIGGEQNLAGQARFRSPDWTGNAGFNYETPVSERFILGIDGSMNFSSKYFTQENNAPYIIQGAYQIYNAGVRLRTEDSRWQVALIGRNLSDKQYIASSHDLPDSLIPGSTIATITRPRQVTLELTWRY